MPAAMSPASAPAFCAWRTRDVMNTVHFGNASEATSNGNVENAARGYYLWDPYKNLYHLVYMDFDLVDDTITSKGSGNGLLRISPISNNENLTKADKSNHSPAEGIIGDMQVDYNTTINGKHTVNGDQLVKGDLKVNEFAEILKNLKVGGNLNVGGTTILQDVTIQGKFNQEGAITSDLHIMGTPITGTILGQRYELDSPNGTNMNNSNSRFALACITEINNIKSFCSGMKVDTTYRKNNSGVNGWLNVSWQDIAGLISSGSTVYRYPTHKIYVGATFILNIKMGYLGYGKVLGSAVGYGRSSMTTVGSRDNSGIWDKTVRDAVNMYNVCEYNIPCYVFKEIYAIIEKNANDPDNTFKTYIMDPANVIRDDSGTIKCESQYLLAPSTPVFFTFAANPQPFRYDGKQYNIQIKFDGLVKAGNHEGGSGNDNWGSPGSSTIKAPIQATIYQGSIEKGNNTAFALKNSFRETSVLTGSAASFIYTTEGNTVRHNAFLFPYHIAETGYDGLAHFESPYEGNGSSRKRAYTQTDSETWEEAFSRFIMNEDLPKMCAIVDSTIKLTKSVDGNKTKYNVETYDTNTQTQRYLSIFNTGKMNLGKLQSVDCSTKISRIFRISDMDVYDGNMNTYYKRIGGESGMENDLQNLIDEEINQFAVYGETGGSTDGSITKFDFEMVGSLPRNVSSYNSLMSTNRFTRGDNTLHVLGSSILFIGNSGYNPNIWNPNDVKVPVNTAENKTEVVTGRTNDYDKFNNLPLY